jgi:hypothetical protein
MLVTVILAWCRVLSQSRLSLLAYLVGGELLA